ncbi:monolysocardiolipin acyltransferase [Sporothrix schenckii 1099-18]|uniref:Tafazzin family protein n=1 Tax=Sporothrix schenckii 1099-18 TaxID=1397361 RepID=A0A0F2LW08_SPOSC|nr:monolysocardiolipin acyltransferase [Sporothrix schenckii 1099-18]KJR81014.1 monolysocardiolipin acyltransferase [Sporothrix schenckii 1099-18]
MSVVNSQPRKPGALWRAASTFVMATTGMLCRSFLYGLNDVEVVGLDNFLKLLDARKDVESRQRGLITVRLDDPLIWGVLPLRYAIDHRNLRWSLGSHDICYKNSFVGHFFCSGQTLPTHRLRHSPWGGLFQPTMNQTVRLLSAQPLPDDHPKLVSRIESLSSPSSPSSISDASSSSAPSDSGPIPPVPATSSKSPANQVFASSFSPSLYYSTNGADRWPAPSAFASNRHAWVHVFPEGLVHQQRDRGLRYFKWGVARLILESEPTPDIVPMFIDGLDRVMHEERTFPRFLPRIGRKIRVVFGDILDPEVFADLRDRWQRLVARSLRSTGHSGARTDGPDGTTAVENDIDLKYGEEAQQLRKETAHRMREEILKLRRRFGYGEEDPRLGLAETWADEPNKKRYRSQVDDSMVYRE